jgi:hypothetical protein
MKRVMIVGGLVLALSACTPPAAVRAVLPKAAAKPAAKSAPAKSKPKPLFPALVTPVVVYGDSLTFEASAYLDRSRMDVRAKGGTAPCDWLEQMTADARQHPAQVIVAFSGNMATACTLRYGARLDAYPVMLGVVAARWPGAAVTLIGAPDSTNGNYPYTSDVRALEAAFAAAHGWGFVDSSGDFDGLARASDSFHFCPGPRDPTTACLVASPAAQRYAEAITSAIAA